MNYVLMGLLFGIGFGAGTYLMKIGEAMVKGIIISATKRNKILAFSKQMAEEYMSQEESHDEPKNRIGF